MARRWTYLCKFDLGPLAENVNHCCLFVWANRSNRTLSTRLIVRLYKIWYPCETLATWEKVKRKQQYNKQKLINVLCYELCSHLSSVVVKC